MSALAMILVGVVLGDGPEKVSGEVEQGLDLSGEWKGIWIRENEQPLGASLREGKLLGRRGKFVVSINQFTLQDEGKGRFRWAAVRDSIVVLGIYKRDGDRVFLCFRDDARRPASFRDGDGQNLLILHRVKPHE